MLPRARHATSSYRRVERGLLSAGAIGAFRGSRTTLASCGRDAQRTLLRRAALRGAFAQPSQGREAPDSRRFSHRRAPSLFCAAFVRPVALRIFDGPFSMVSIFLVLRLVFSLFGANSSGGFVSWPFSMTAVLLQPVRGVFPTTTYENQDFPELSRLFASLPCGLASMATRSRSN